MVSNSTSTNQCACTNCLSFSIYMVLNKIAFNGANSCRVKNCSTISRILSICNIVVYKVTCYTADIVVQTYQLNTPAIRLIRSVTTKRPVPDKIAINATQNNSGSKNYSGRRIFIKVVHSGYKIRIYKNTWKVCNNLIVTIKNSRITRTFVMIYGKSFILYIRAV